MHKISQTLLASFAGTTISLCPALMHKTACSWIVDSGACNHMVYDENILINKRYLNQQIKVGLPDVNVRCVRMKGSVVFE